MRLIKLFFAILIGFLVYLIGDTKGFNDGYEIGWKLGAEDMSHQRENCK